GVTDSTTLRFLWEEKSSSAAARCLHGHEPLVRARVTALAARGGTPRLRNTQPLIRRRSPRSRSLPTTASLLRSLASPALPVPRTPSCDAARADAPVRGRRCTQRCAAAGESFANGSRA